MNDRLKTVALVMVCLVILGCTGKHVTGLDGDHPALDGCYPLPNCVSSTTWVLYNRTPPFELAISPEAAWPRIREVVANLPRTEIVEEGGVYIHAKCRSRVFRFVDHLELLLHPDQGTVSVRSSSMIALFDFGVNRWRIHQLRKQLEEMGIINY